MDRWLTDTSITELYPAWTRGNAADVLPDPVSPLMWTLYWQPALMTGLRDAYIRFGVVNWDEFVDPNHPDVFGCFGGYFFNPLSLTRLMGARMPGLTAEAVDRAYFDDRPDVPLYVAEPWHDSEANSAKLAEGMAWVMTTDGFPELDAQKAVADGLRASRPDLRAASDPALLARARSIVPYLQDAMEMGMVVSTAGAIPPGALGAIGEAIGDPTLTVRLMAGVEVDSAKPPFAMWELSRLAAHSEELNAEFAAGVVGLLDRLRSRRSAEAGAFLAGFERFLFDYGSRGPGEWDLIAKAWEPYPEVALAAIDRMRVADDASSPVTRHRASVAERDRLADEVRAKLAGDAETLAGFEAAYRAAAVFMAGRERYKTNCIKLVNEIRVCLLELGARGVARGHLDKPEQIWMLLASELDEFRHEPARFTERLRAREQDYWALYDLEPPFALNGRVAPMSEWPVRKVRVLQPAPPGSVLRGGAASGGVATGRARVILDPSDPLALEPGEVLIAPNTDPSWTPLFVPAAGVVVNVGALGSHAMIVCRDLGIPCVASVVDATLRIPDGALVRVDGDAGTVTLL